ncbi:unnamed protein product [Closterium sp. NIES-54]
MFITLYFIVTRLPDSLRSVRDHSLSLDPTSLTVDLLDQHLLAAENSAVAVGAVHGTPRTPFFEGCSPSPLAPSYASAAADGRGGGGGSGSGGGGSSRGSGGSGGGGSGGSGGGSGGIGGGGKGSGGSGSSGSDGGRTGAQRGGSQGGQRKWQQCRSETPLPKQLRASKSILPGTAPAEALHTFMLDSSASRCLFRDSTTLTPLPAPVPVRLADPSEGPVVVRSSTVLPCLELPSGSLSGLHLPSLSTNMVAPPCMCRLVSHQTLLWHHRLGHPSLPRLRGMHSRLLVSGFPRSLPPLLPLPALPCLPCVKGRQRATPHSSSFPPTAVGGLARVSGQNRERYFLLVVDDYTRYTTVFPLRSKGLDLPVLRLHCDRGGEFSSDHLWDICRGEGILQSFTLSDSPQQNGIAERRIGLVMEVARTSMIHAAAPHFLWSFAVRYAAHQLNLWPRVYFPKTSPTLRWTGKVGDASVFRDVTFDESVPFYRLFPYRSALPPPPELFLAPGPPPGAGSGGAEPGGEEPGGAEPAGVEPGCAASSRGPAGASLRLSPQQLREWFVRHACLWSGATGAGGAGAGGTGGTAATSPGGARTRGTGSAGTGGVGGAGAGDPTELGAAGAGGSGAGGAGVGGARAGGAGIGGTGAGGAGAGGNDAGGAGVGGTSAGGLELEELELLTQEALCGHDHTSFPYFSRVKRPPGSLPALKARYVARGFSQQQGVYYFQTFSSTSKMTTLRVLLHVAAQRDYELHSLDFSTDFLQGSLHKEI